MDRPAAAVADRARFYLDEDALDRELFIAMQNYGLDVMTSRQALMLNRPDEDHLAWATADRRVLYSYNARDYQRIHSEWVSSDRAHAGIVLAGQRQFTIGEQARRLAILSRRASATAMRDRIEYLSGWS
jgi:hypothetical protein